MRRTLGWPAVLLVALLFVSLIPGCAARMASDASPASAPSQPNLSTGNSSGIAPSASNDKVAAPSAESGQAAGSSADESSAPWDRMVIRTSNLTVTVNDVEATLASIRDIANATESFVANSQTQYVGDNMTATITLQVPARSFDTVIQQVRKLAVKVETEQTSSQDVTEEYVDLQSQINNLKATEQTMIRLLDRATQMNEILTIQRELSTVRGQIERIQGRMNYIQRRSEYSTLAIRVQPVGSAIDPFATSSWQPLRTISRAWQASLQTIAAVADVVLALVVFLWWLIPIVVLLVWLWRRRRRTPRPVPAAASGPTAPGTAS